MIPVSVTILTCNSARHLAKVLAALRQFEEVVVLDSGSKDETLTIAKSFPNVRICRVSSVRETDSPCRSNGRPASRKTASRAAAPALKSL